MRLKSISMLLLIIGFYCISLSGYSSDAVLKFHASDLTEITNLKVFEQDSFIVLNGVLSQLVTTDYNGNIIGDIAETWEVSDNGKVYTFNLKKGVYFTNGDEVTSEYVLYMIKRSILANGLYKPLLEKNLLKYKKINMNSTKVNGVEIVGKYKVIIRFNKSWASFLSLLSNDLNFAIIHPKMGDVNSLWLNLNMPSSGLFKVESYNSNEIVLLKRSDHYLSNYNVPNKILIKKLSRQDALKYLRDGEVINIMFIGANEAKRIREEKLPITLFRSRSSLITYVRCNNNSVSLKKYPLLCKHINDYLQKDKYIISDDTKPLHRLFDEYQSDKQKLNILNEADLKKYLKNNKINLDIILPDSGTQDFYDAFNMISKDLLRVNIILNIIKVPLNSFYDLSTVKNEYDMIVTSSIKESGITEDFVTSFVQQYQYQFSNKQRRDLSEFLKKLNTSKNIDESNQVLRDISVYLIDSSTHIPLFAKNTFWAMCNKVYKNGVPVKKNWLLDAAFFHQIRLYE